MDVGEDRLRLLRSYEMELATGLHPGRIGDPFKPTTAGRNDSVNLTRLTIDHVTPEAGLGATSTQNLKFTCAFCNNGKGIYRWALEDYGRAAAAAFVLVHQTHSGHNMLRQGLAWSAIAGQRRCGNPDCQRSAEETELTVILPSVSPILSSSWALDVRCYDCIISDGSLD